jgi:hypothetical protein
MTTEKRFTIDGSPQLEQHIAALCKEASATARAVFPADRFEALVLGGGYGRGQGGVRVTPEGDRPYNDLEFYVFLRGPRVLNQRKYQPLATVMGESLSPSAGLHVEFKVDALASFRHRPISMFSYDLVAGHRIVHGSPNLFAGCDHHLRASELPPAEATRLLFNRCTGLLMVRELLGKTRLSLDDEDFICRNLAKARLALGDALLAFHGEYHWSCLERRERLTRWTPPESLPWLEQVRQDHAAGVAFKLLPNPLSKSPAEFSAEHRRISALAAKVWLWLEGRRLQREFGSARDYALAPCRKWPGSSAWRNCLLSLKTFGPAALLDRQSWWYPRDRLFSCLPLLLWDEESAHAQQCLQLLQERLHTRAVDWDGLVGAYKRVWASYG